MHSKTTCDGRTRYLVSVSSDPRLPRCFSLGWVGIKICEASSSPGSGSVSDQQGDQAFVVADLPIPAFSLSIFGLNVASWSVILRPKARSTLAPSANLLKLSVFSCVGAYLCCCSCFCSSRCRPCDHSLISAIRGSPAVVVATVWVVASEAAIEGALKVENLFEVRFDATCPRSADVSRIGVGEIVLCCQKARACRQRRQRLTLGAIIGREDSWSIERPIVEEILWVLMRRTRR